MTLEQELMLKIQNGPCIKWCRQKSTGAIVMGKLEPYHQQALLLDGSEVQKMAEGSLCPEPDNSLDYCMD